ncbi:unnamed protein product [Timema podura]|uniref:Uncharacterized protein n=1 Tax=Timema podura TaxID=61482 RepID=A0ABN7NX22_TIMPD|nr:unnamed protein product [Timema podura]
MKVWPATQCFETNEQLKNGVNNQPGTLAALFLDNQPGTLAALFLDNQPGTLAALFLDNQPGTLAALFLDNQPGTLAALFLDNQPGTLAALFLDNQPGTLAALFLDNQPGTLAALFLDNQPGTLAALFLDNQPGTLAALFLDNQPGTLAALFLDNQPVGSKEDGQTTQQYQTANGLRFGPHDRAMSLNLNHRLGLVTIFPSTILHPPFQPSSIRAPCGSASVALTCAAKSHGSNQLCDVVESRDGRPGLSGLKKKNDVPTAPNGNSVERRERSDEKEKQVVEIKREEERNARKNNKTSYFS